MSFSNFFLRAISIAALPMLLSSQYLKENIELSIYKRWFIDAFNFAKGLLLAMIWSMKNVLAALKASIINNLAASHFYVSFDETFAVSTIFSFPYLKSLGRRRPSADYRVEEKWKLLRLSCAVWDVRILRKSRWESFFRGQFDLSTLSYISRPLACDKNKSSVLFLAITFHQQKHFALTTLFCNQ